MYNFELVNCDTDSIMFAKSDGSDFSSEEQEELLNGINLILPDKIKLAHDGYFPRVVVIKSKNYILDNGKKVKFKGSSLVDSKKEPIILELVHEIGNILLDGNTQKLLQVYERYIQLALNINDIKPWATKKTITKSVLNPTRTNEQKVKDAIGEKDVQEGDKIYLYYDNSDNLNLVDTWTKGSENKKRLVKRVWDTFSIFKTVIDIEQFPKYHNKKLFEKLTSINS